MADDKDEVTASNPNPDNIGGNASEEVPSFLKDAYKTHTVSYDNDDAIEAETVDEKDSTAEVDTAIDGATDPASRLEGFLGELNLTKKHIIIFVLILASLVIGIIFSLKLLFSYFGNDVKDVVVTPVVVSTEVKTDAPKSESFFGKYWNKIFGPKILPTEVTPVKTPVTPEVKNPPVSVLPVTEIGSAPSVVYNSKAIPVTVLIGLTEKNPDKLSLYIRTYRKVRSIFNTDLFNFLSVSPDRTKAFDEYLITFKGSNEALKLQYEDLRQEVAQYKSRLTKLSTEAQFMENNFFNALDKLDSEGLPDLLKAFEAINSKKDIMKAELQARDAIAIKIGKALPLITAKITAIEANRDAFVKGVKVVNFRQVDLDLIIEGQVTQ